MAKPTRPPKAPAGRMYITGDERAAWINTAIDGLRHNFAIGDIRSAVIVTAWSDGEPGGDYHIENPADRAVLVRHLETVLAQLKRLY